MTILYDFVYSLFALYFSPSSCFEEAKCHKVPLLINVAETMRDRELLRCVICQPTVASEFDKNVVLGSEIEAVKEWERRLECSK